MAVDLGKAAGFVVPPAAIIGKNLSRNRAVFLFTAEYLLQLPQALLRPNFSLPAPLRQSCRGEIAFARTVIVDQQPVVESQVTIRQAQIVFGRGGNLFDQPVKIVGKITEGARCKRYPGITFSPVPFHQHTQGLEGVSPFCFPEAVFQNRDLLPLAFENKEGVTGY